MNRLKTLMYHSVSDTLCNDYKFSISVNDFKNQLSFITKNYNTIFISEVSSNKLSGNKNICITFDDGHIDNYVNVFPVIKKMRVKITIYLSQFCENFTLMSNDMIREMHDSGLVEFGCHTVNHKNLTTLSDDEVYSEIVESKKIIEKVIKSDIKSFAYPYGKFNNNIVDIVKKSGFTTAVTTKKSNISYMKLVDNMFNIPRINIKNDINMFKFRLALQVGRYSF